MKTFIIVTLTGLIVLCAMGCSTRVKLSKSKVHKSNKISRLRIDKIIVDSFNAAGMPVKYRTDSVFYAEYDDGNIADPASLKTSRFRKTIWFTRTNKHYKWYSWKGADWNRQQPGEKPNFVPLTWYHIATDCKFGFLMTGHCIIYFYLDKNEKLVQYRTEHKNEGPF